MGHWEGSCLHVQSWICLLYWSWGLSSVNFTMFSSYCLTLGSKILGLSGGFLTDWIWSFFLIQFPSCKEGQSNTSTSSSSNLQAASEASVKSASHMSHCRRDSSHKGSHSSWHGSWASVACTAKAVHRAPHSLLTIPALCYFQELQFNLYSSRCFQDFPLSLMRTLELKLFRQLCSSLCLSAKSCLYFEIESHVTQTGLVHCVAKVGFELLILPLCTLSARIVSMNSIQPVSSNDFISMRSVFIPCP